MLPITPSANGTHFAPVILVKPAMENSRITAAKLRNPSFIVLLTRNCTPAMTRTGINIIESTIGRYFLIPPSIAPTR